MQITAYAPQIIKTHQKITKVIDGDGLCVIDMFGKNEIEIRFLGIDAPEIKRSKKLMQDERETHLPSHPVFEVILRNALEQLHRFSSTRTSGQNGVEICKRQIKDRYQNSLLVINFL